MSDKNNLVNLGLHSNITEDDLRDAMQGQPEPVEEEKPASTDLDLGKYGDMLYESKDGVFGVNNEYDLQYDMDQFKDQKWLGGLSTRVSGLDDGFTYTGLSDVYDRSQEAQGSLEKIRNGIFQFVGDTAINVAQGFGTLLYGLPSAVVNGEFSKIYDNALSNALDRGQEEYDKYFDIKRGGNQSGLQQVSNFLFDDVLGGVSFVAGAILTEIGLTAATVATMGGAGAAQAAATAGIVARGTRLLKTAVNGGKRMIGGQLVDDAARQAAQLAGTATREAAEAGIRSAGAAGARSQSLSAAGRTARQLLTGAGMESGMEARHMLNAAGEDHKREYEKEHGAGTYTEEMEAAFRDEITPYGNAVFGANMALVGASNMLMFPKLFGTGLRNGLRSTKFVDTTKMSAKARQRLAKRMGVAEGDLPRLMDASRATRTGRNLRRITPGSGVLGTALYEGFAEEGGQGTISRGFEDYISHKYDPRNQKETADFVNSFYRGLQGSYGTAEGLKEVGIGVLLGAFGIPNIMIANAYSEVDPVTGKKVKPAFVGGFTQIRRDNAERDAMMDRLVRLHEESGDVGKILAAEIDNMVTQRGLIRQADAMANQNDFKGLKDNEANSIFAHASSKILTGRFEDSMIEAKEVLDGMTVEEYREMLGENAMDMTDEELRSRKSAAYDNYVKRMNEVRDAYRKAREVYRGENHDALNGIANLLYNTKDRDNREQYVANSLAEKVKGLNGQAVLDGARLQEQLGITQRQLDKLIAIEDQLDEAERSPEGDARREKIEQLNAKKEALVAGFRGKDKIGKYKFDNEAFLSDLQGLLDTNRALAALNTKGVTEYDKGEIAEMVMDLQELVADRQAMIETYNDLIEEGGYERFIAAMEAGVRSVISQNNDEDEAALAEELEAEKEMYDEADTDVPPAGPSPAEMANEPSVPGEDGPPGSQPPAAAMYEDLSEKPPGESETPEGMSPAEAAAQEVDRSEDEPSTEAPTEQREKDEVDPNSREPNVTPGEPTGMSPAEEADRAQATPADNTEDVGQQKSPEIFDLQITVDDPKLTGLPNPRFDAAARDIIAHGVAIGEEITLSRTVVPMGNDVYGSGISFSIRGKEFAVVPASALPGIYNTLDQPRTARVKGVKEAKFGGSRISGTLQDGTELNQTKDAREVLDENSLLDIAVWRKTAGQNTEFQTLTRTDMEVPQDVQPTTKTGKRLLGKPYALVKDARTGKMFYVPARMKSVGKPLAQGILQAERAVAAVVEGKVNNAFPQMTMQQAEATVANLEKAFGWDIRNAAGVIDNKRLTDSFQQLMSQYLMLETGKVGEVASTDHSSYKKRPALIYFGGAQPGLRIYSKDKTYVNRNGQSLRSFNRSHELTENWQYQQAVNAIASMQRNVSFEHQEGRVSQVFQSLAVNDETGIVEIGDPVSVKQYYLNNLEFNQRIPVMINDKPYGNFVEQLTVELGDVQVPTAPEVDTDTENTKLTDEESAVFDQFDDELFMLAPTDKLSPLERAGSLYAVEGLSQKVTQDALNFMVGRIATRMSRHSKTTRRTATLKAVDLKRQIRMDIETVPAYVAAKKIALQPEHPRYDAAVRVKETYDKMLEDKTFDRLMDLGFLEVLREARGIIKLKSGNIADAIKEVAEERDQVLEDQNKTPDDVQREENPMAAFDDNFAFGVDPKSALRFELKLALMTVQYAHSNASTNGALGRKFVNQRTLIGHLNQAMAGAQFNWPSMKTRLERFTPTFPYFRTILNLMDDAQLDTSSPYYAKEQVALDMMRNQFVTGMAKNVAEFVSLKVRKDTSDVDAMGRPTGNVAKIFQFSSNDTNMVEFVMKELESRFIINGFYTRLNDGTVKVNKDKVRAFVNKLDTIAKENSDPVEAAKETSKLLASDLGLDLPYQALNSKNSMVNTLGAKLLSGIEKDLVNPDASDSIFGSFRYGLRDVLESEDDTLSITDPGNERRAGITEFVATVANYQDNLIQNSSKDGSGKLRWQYTAPKHAQKMFNDLMEIARDEDGNIVTDEDGNAVFMVDMQADWTLRNNPLLMEMRKKSNRPYAKFRYVDGVKLLDSLGDVRDFHKMEPGDRLLARLAYFGNNNTYRSNGRQMYSMHMMPTLADKHTMPLVQIPSLQLQMRGIQPRVEGEAKIIPHQRKISDFFDLDKAYDMTMRASIDLELTRIRAVQSKKKGEVFATLDAKQQTNDRFVLMPALNGMQDKTDAEIHAAAKEIFKSQAQSSFTNAMIDAEDMLYTYDPDKGTMKLNYFDPTVEDGATKTKPFDYVRVHAGMKSVDFRDNPLNKEHAFMGFIAKFAIESLYFNTNITTAMLGDPGAFRKGNAEQTATNMGKRFAALIAPGNVIPEVTYTAKRPTYDKDGNVIMKNGKPVLKEVKDVSNKVVRSLVMPERQISEAEHIAYLKEIGLTEDQLDSYRGYDTADAAEYTTAEEHLSILYAQGKIDRDEFEGILRKVNEGVELNNEERGWFQPMKPVTVERKDGHLLYIKSASFPLVPGLTKNQSLDDLRVFMERNNIQRAAYTSAVKVGNPYADMVDVHDAEGKVQIQPGLENQVIEYKRESVRIQQEVPVSKTTEKIHGSQVAKLILANLADKDTQFELDGKPITGRDLYSRYIQAREDEIKARKQIFAARYGMTLNASGELVPGPEYAKKMAARILEEAIERGYDVNELAHLQFNEETGMFYTPISQGPSAERVEQLMISILRKELVESRITGFSGPIRPETGMEYKSLQDMDQSDIVWVKNSEGKLYNGKKLKVAKYEQPNQIIMPWKFAGKLEKLKNEDGTIDMDRLPKEVFQALAYRIPGQKKASSASFEIVGFLPKRYGDTLIVPEELVGQIGQDYDIDKMFGFLHETEIVDGKLQVIRDVKAEQRPVRKVISGGQTGVDRIGLEVAQSLGYQTGGVAPAGFKTEQGADTSLEEFGLTAEGDYRSRTIANIKRSGGTVVFSEDMRSAGTRLTIAEANKAGKPIILNPSVEELKAWMKENKIRTLNVAGNRGSKMSQAAQDNARAVLQAALRPEIVETGERARAVARNQVIDIYHATLRSQDPRALIERHSPVTDGFSAELGDKLGLMRQATGMPMAFDYNDVKADIARSAKDAIGVFASANVLHSQMEQASQGEGMFEYILYRDEVPIEKHVDIWVDRNTPMSESDKARRFGVRDIHDDTYVFEYESTPGRITRQEQFSRLLNHAVDNENNQLLSKLNINSRTWSLWSGLTHMGYNMETIGLFMTMPMLVAKTEDAMAGGGLVQGRVVSAYDAELMETISILKANGLMDDKGQLLGEYYARLENGDLPRLNKKDMLRFANGEKVADLERAVLNWQTHQAIGKLNTITGALSGFSKSMKFDTKMGKTRGEIDFERMLGMAATADLINTENNQGLTMVSGRGLGHVKSSVSQQAFSVLNATIRDVLDLAGESVYGTPTYAEGSMAIIAAQEKWARNNRNPNYNEDLKTSYWAYNGEFFSKYLKEIKSYLYNEWAEKIGGKDAKLLRQELFLGSNNMAVQLENMRATKKEVRNNTFIQHLIAESQPRKGYPRVEFQGDRQVNVNPIEMHAAFLALVKSSDPEVAAFGKNLVVYNLLTGKQLSSKGYGKYVPAEVLQEYGIREALGFEHEVYGGWRAEEAIHDQIVLHNPDMAPYLTKAMMFPLLDVKNKKVKFLTPEMELMGWFQTSKGLYKLILEKPATSRSEAVYRYEGPYQSRGDFFSAEYAPKQQIAMNDKPELVMDKNNKKGRKDGMESTEDANPNNEAYTPTDADVPQGPSPAQMAAESSARQERSEEPTGMSPAEAMAMAQAAESNRPMTAAEFIKQRIGKDAKRSRLLRQLAALEERRPGTDRVKIVFEETPIPGRYQASTNQITISKDLMDKPGDLVRVLTHEMVHAYTADAMRKDKTGVPIRPGSVEVQEAVIKIGKLYNQITTSPELMKGMGLSIEDLQKFKEGTQLRVLVARGEVKLEDLPDNARKLYDFANNAENFQKYYGFMNEKEMVAEIFTNPNFAKQLSQIKFNRTETWLDRIIKYVGEILSGLGVEIVSGTYAEEVAAATMDLIQKNAKLKGVTIKSEKKLSLGERAAMDDVDYLLDTDLDEFSLDENTVAKLIDYKTKRIREYKEMRSRYRQDKELVKRLNQRIGLEERELDMLRDDSVGELSLESIIDMANRELDDAENVIRSANTTGDVRLAQSALQNASSVVDFYADIRGIIDKRGPIREEANKLVARASTLQMDYHEKATAILRAQAKARFRGTAGEKYVKSDSFEQMDNIQGLVSWFMDASRQGRIELSFLDSVIKDSVRMQQVQFNSRAQLYMAKSKEMQKGAYFKKHGFEGFVTLDSKGNPTPNIITIIGGKWDTAHAAKQNSLRNSPGAYYKWLHDNTGRMKVNRMFDYSGDTVVRKADVGYISVLESKYGKLGAEEFIRRQEVALQQYVDARNAEFDIIEVENSDKAVQDKLKKEWLDKNDPALHEQYIAGKKKAPKGAFNKYLFNMPNKEYQDERFIEMQNDPAAVEYYNEYRRQMMEMMSMLPMHKMGNALDRAQMQNGLFMPAIKRSMVNDVMKGDFSGLNMQSVTDAMLRSMTVTEEDLQGQLIDPVTGAKREELPVWFTNKLKDNADYDYNMDRTFLAFAMMASTYDAKNQIEDTVRMTRGVLAEVKVNQKNSLGRKILSKMGVPLASRTADDRASIDRVVQTMVNQYYGHSNVKDQTVNAPERMWTKETKEAIAKLRAQLERAKTDKERKLIEQKIDLATPKISAAKTAYGMQQWIQAKGMGWNIPAAATNLLYGTLAVEQYGAGEREFGTRAARKAVATMMHSSLNNMSLNTGYTQTATAKKIQGMMITLDVLKDFTEIRFDPSRYVKNASESGISAANAMGIKKLRMYEIQRSSEYFVYGAGTIAVLLETKVDGKSLWEHMDGNGIIQLDGYRPGEEKHTALVNKIDQVNKRIHGNYDPNSPIAIKKTFYGPLLMQFKSWLPEAVAQRVEAERYDPYLDREVKGRWWTLMEHRTQLHKLLLPRLIPILGRKLSFDENMKEVDKENIRKSAANFRHMMYLYFMIQALGHMIDDEDDEAAKRKLNYLMNIMHRAHNDQTAFMNPLAFDKLVGGGRVAALDTMQQLYKFGEASWDAAWGEPTIETGTYAGTNKMLHHGGKLIPHSAAIQRHIRTLDRVLNN